MAPCFRPAHAVRADDGLLALTATLLLLLGGPTHGMQDSAPDGTAKRPALNLHADRFPILARLSVGQAPHQIVFSADGTTAWVAVAGSDRVVPIDVATRTAGAALATPGVPLGLALPAGADLLLVTAFAGEHLQRLALPGGEISLGPILGGGASLITGPLGDGRWLVSSEETHRMLVLDALGTEVLASHVTGQRPFPPAVTSDGRRAFVPSYDDGLVTIIDLDGGQVLSQVEVGTHPSGGVVLPGDALYAVAVRGQNQIALLDTSRQIVVNTISEGIGEQPFSIVVAPDGRRAFVNNTASHDVSVLALPELTAVARLPTGEIPICLAVHPSGDTLWVACEGTHEVLVIGLPPLGGETQRDMAPSIERAPLFERAPSIEHDARLEVDELHAFFEAWFSARLPNDDASYARFADVLTDDFEIISPEGQRTGRAELLAGLRAAHGSRASDQSAFRIEVREPRTRRVGDDLVIVTYEEWQRVGTPEERGRLSTALLRREPGMPRGLAWVHVHEVWLP